MAPTVCRQRIDNVQPLPLPHIRLAQAEGDGGRVTWPAVAFGLGEADVREGQRLDVVYSLSADRRSEALELRVKDVAPAEPRQDQCDDQKGNAR